MLTTVPVDPTALTYYFRHAFNVADASVIQALALEIERDDAAVVYLNGHEVMRSNLPAGPIDASTKANGSSWARETASVDPALLRDGSNLLAVEIHQRSSGATSDFAFDLELRGTSCDPCRIGTLELPPVADTYIQEEDPTDDSGNSSGMWVKGETDDRRSALLAWDLTQVPAGVTVVAAEILFDVQNDTTAYYPLYQLSRAWSEDDATWEEAESGVDWQVDGALGNLDRGAVKLGVAHRVGLGPYALSFNTAGRSLVADWISGATSNHGLVLGPETSKDSFKVSSKEGSSAPLLRIVYSQTCSP